MSLDYAEEGVVVRINLTIVAAATMAIVIGGCAREVAEKNPCPASGARIYVKSDGTALLNGAIVEVDGFGDALAALAPAPTVACYSRDAAEAEPHPAASRVVQAIIDQRLPVAFYTDDTFKVVVELPKE